MKHIFWFLIALPIALHSHPKDSLGRMLPKILPSELAFAKGKCDACGCSASGGSMGFASMLNSRFLGVRYIYQRYRTTDGLYSNSPWHSENFSTLQLWGRLPIGEKLNVTVMVPYHHNTRGTADGDQSIEGFGDVTLLALYPVYSTLHDTITRFPQEVRLGAGVKIPLGTYSSDNNGSINPGFQLGTGSWDVPLAAEYLLKYRKWGMNAMANYIVKTENSKEYRFGNQFNYAGTFFYLRETETWTFSPQLGFAGEVYDSNYQHGQRLTKTSGDVFFGKAGFEAAWKRLSVGTTLLLPVSQNLTGGNVEAKYRFSFNLNYKL